MLSKYYKISKIVFIVFLFFTGLQIANSQCKPGDLDTDSDGICNIEDLDDDNDGILDLNESYPYLVYQYNRPNASFATNVPFEITGNNTVTGTYNSAGIEGDLTKYGYSWDLIASDVYPNGNGEIIVKINPNTNTNNTYVLADAVLITNGKNTFVIDETDPGFSTAGEWTYQAISNSYQGDNYFVSSSNYVGVSATWSFTNLLDAYDTDNDGIANALDTDSDNDGCPDALEGDGVIGTNDLVHAPSTLSDGNGNIANQNLGTNVNMVSTSLNYGVPLIAASGQGSGFSLDVNNSAACEDSDGDGVSDEFDRCPNIDDKLLNSACNDNAACTINDVYVDCDCKGTKLPDSDNDGICNSIDICSDFDDELDIDDDGIPYCLDNCIDVDEDNICDENDNSVIVDDLKIRFSQERGFYEDTFSLSILSNDPNAIIKYSTSQSIIPSVTGGSIYQSPIKVTIPNDGIFVVKAFTYNSYDTTKVKTHSYVFLNQVHLV